MFAAVRGLIHDDPDDLRGTALLLAAGSASQLFVRSRVFLLADRVFIVNVLFWCEIPYRLIRKAEGGLGNGLSVYLKDTPSEDSELHVIAFVGSLMDHRWRTAEKAVKVINKSKKRAVGKCEAGDVRRRGIIRDPVVETFAVLALVAIAASLFVSTRRPDGRSDYGLSWSWGSETPSVGFNTGVSFMSSNATDFEQLRGDGWGGTLTGAYIVGATVSHERAIDTTNSRGEPVGTTSVGLVGGFAVEAGVTTSHNTSVGRIGDIANDMVNGAKWIVGMG
ncbi:hypothetical protein [Streptomyces sp. NPDC055186]